VVVKGELSNVSFDSHSSDSVLSKKKEFIETQKSEPKNTYISFEVKAIDDFYDNMFQTASDPWAVRLELTHPNTLNLLLGNDVSGLTLYKVTENFTLNVWHTVVLTIDENKKAEVIIDSQKVLFFTDKNINYEISEIVVGAGYNKQRGFQGEIKNFHIGYERYRPSFVLE